MGSRSDRLREQAEAERARRVLREQREAVEAQAHTIIIKRTAATFEQEASDGVTRALGARVRAQAAADARAATDAYNARMDARYRQ